jgi:ligand-binding sensor domain-containing protein/signal transduction histidine kinase
VRVEVLRRRLEAVTVSSLCLIRVLLHAGEDGSSLARDLVVRSWGTESGLPQNTITTMLQTRNGYLWVGTRDGLARFDGMRFTVYGLRDGLRSIEIQTLYEDRRGRIYIGTSGGGVSRFDSGKIESLPLPMDLASAAGQIVSAIAEDTAGRLWIGTRAGLRVWHGDNFDSELALNVLTNTAISALAGDRRGRMWIATAAHGLFLFEEGTVREVRGPPGNEVVLAYCLLQDQTANLWAAIGNGVLLCRVQDDWRVFTRSNGVPYAYITSLAQEPDGTLWAGSLDEGLFYLSGDQFYPVTTRDGLSSDDVRSLLPDREGNLWVGTRSAGLNRVNRRTVETWGRSQGMTNDFARGVAEMADGSLWVGITGGGLYRGHDGAFTSFGPEPLIRAHPFVEAVLATDDGGLWWGAARALFCWRGGRLAAVYTGDPWILSSAVTALCQAHHSSTGSSDTPVWVGTSEGRLILCSASQSREIPLPVASGAITALISEREGGLWVGSAAGGLRHISPDMQSVTSVTNGLPSQSIRTLYRDAEGKLWVGTAGGGLAVLRDGRIEAVGRDQGLSVNTVSQILEDDFGSLWLGTSRGIYRVPKSQLDQRSTTGNEPVHPQVFGLNHGMPAEECSGGFFPAGLKTRNNKLCFPTIKGLVIIDPARQQSDPPLSEVLIEEVLVRGRPRPPSSNPATSDSWPSLVILSPGERELEIAFTAVTLRAPEQVRFRYRMKGFDTEWVESGARRVAHYPKMTPGRFAFEVSACNADGVWMTPAVLVVQVRPFLWEQTWFRSIMVVLVLGAFAGMLRVHERRKYHRQLAVLHTQAAVEKERLRISQDMHDHIGGLLTQVSLLSELAQDEAQGESKARFQRISSQTRSAVQALDEIIWATNPRNDNLPRFVEYVSRVADECFESSGIRCWQDLPGQLPQVPLRADVRHNLFLAIRESFNNVLKHSGAKETWLRVALNGSELSIVVEDNGRGLDPGTNLGRGNGLVNMQARMVECGGALVIESGQGARLRFTVPLQATVSIS